VSVGEEREGKERRGKVRKQMDVPLHGYRFFLVMAFRAQ
jgi:hypothetical protein